MNMKFFNFLTKSKYFIFLMLIVLSYFGLYHNISADYMQSSTYKIQSDSVNIGGTNSSSGTYKLNDSVGEVGT